MAGYAKLFGSILFSTIWAESKDVKILWITMLALADADGTVEAAVPGLAMASRLTPDECRAALTVLESPDPDSKNPENEGRRVEKIDGGWRILNYLHYRNKMTTAYRRELNAERVRRHRENTKREPKKPAAEPEPATDFDGSPNETICPADMRERAEKILPDLVCALRGSTTEQVRASADRFATYYIIGKGAGQKRRFWMRELRGWITRDHGEGKLKVNGERKPRNAADALYARALAAEAEDKRKAAE